MKHTSYPRKGGPKIYYGVGFTHAHKDGSPVLIDHSSWRTINGVYWSFRGGTLHMLRFRRYDDK